MAKKEYSKPSLISDRIFTLTSQACNTSGDPGFICAPGSIALMWTNPQESGSCCVALIKSIAELTCEPPGLGESVQYS